MSPRRAAPAPTPRAFDALLDELEVLPLIRSSIARSAAVLPSRAADLKALLVRSTARRGGTAFTLLALAALAAERPVDGALLSLAADLPPDGLTLCAIAAGCKGDAACALVQAATNGLGCPERRAQALYAAAWLCRERRVGLPAGLNAEACHLAALGTTGPAAPWLRGLASVLGDPDLDELVSTLEDTGGARRLAKALDDEVLEATSLKPVEVLPEALALPLAPADGPVLRVDKVGRNDPCPCGSGQKYKKCHGAGAPVAALQQALPSHAPSIPATPEDLAALPDSRVAALAAAKLPPALHAPLAERLLALGCWSALMTFWMATPWRKDLDGALLRTLDEAARDGRAEVVQWLWARRPVRAKQPRERSPAVTLALTGEKAGPVLDYLEGQAQEALEGDAAGLAGALLRGPCPALGVLLARGALLLADRRTAALLHADLGDVRDGMEKDYRDPIDPLWRRHLKERGASGLVAAMAGAAAPANSSGLPRAKEHRALQEEALSLRRRVRTLESKLAAGTPTPAPGPAAPVPLEELRSQLKELKQSQKELHAERNGLRAELAEARAVIESFTAPLPATATVPAVPAEPDLAPGPLADQASPHPLRLPRFEPAFARSLDAVPRKVAAATLEAVGLLAAGSAPAYREVHPLQGRRDIWRKRIGIHHRLLFRLLDDELHVLDLVTREDLERWIRNQG